VHAPTNVANQNMSETYLHSKAFNNDAKNNDSS